MRYILVLLSIMPTVRAGDGKWIEKIAPTAIIGLFAGIGVHQHHLVSSERIQREIDTLQETVEENSKLIDRLEEHGLVAQKDGAILICNPFNRALNKAILKNDISAINVLFRYAPKTFDINTSDEDGHNALHLAARKGNPESIQFLLSHNAEINAKDLSGKTPLHYAVMGVHPVSAQVLLEHNANPIATDTKGMHALHYAAELCIPHVIRALLPHYTDKEIAHQADKAGRTPLLHAMARQHLATIDLLLQTGADPNAYDTRGMNALHYAAQSGNIKILKLLIAAGGDINKENVDGKKPIELAYAAKKQHLIDYILSIPHAQDQHGMTHLHHAAKAGNIEKMQDLIEAGLDVNLKDNKERTPLMLALDAQKEEAVRYILFLQKTHHKDTHKEEVEYTANHVSALHMCMDIKDQEKREKATDILLSSLTERDIATAASAASSSSSSSSGCSSNECGICFEDFSPEVSRLFYTCCSNTICLGCKKQIESENCPYCRATSYKVLNMQRKSVEKPLAVED